MKKLIYCALALAAGLFAASCQQENLEPVAQENTVTYTVDLPEVQTKTIGDGLNVDQLVYEVWKTGENGELSTRLYQKTLPLLAPGAERRWIVSLNLVQNQTYKVLFWAQVAEAEAYNTEKLTDVYFAKDLTKGYFSNQESYAAFYGTDVLDTNTPLKGKTITLTRPFAQLNIGTLNTALTDEYSIKMDKSSVVVEVPTHFNVSTSDVANAEEITFNLANVPTATLPVSDKPYNYVAMNYVFAGEKTTSSVEYTIETTITPTANASAPTTATIYKTIPNVPLQENYRTNIVGNLLTSSAQYEVVIDKNFNNPEYVIGEEWIQTGEYTYTIMEGASALALKEVLAHANSEARAAATKSEGPEVTIELNGDVEWATEGGHGSSPLLPAESLISKVIINGNGKTFTATGAGVGSIRLANGGLLTFNNVNIVDKTVSYAENAWEFTYLEFAGNLAFNICTFNSGVQFQTEDNEVVLNASFADCQFISNEADVYCAWVSDGITSFNGCTFKGTRGLKIHEDYGSEVISVTVDGCEFGPMSKKPGIAFGTLNPKTSVTIENSVFDGCQAGKQNLYMYETDTDVTEFDFHRENNTVIPASNADSYLTQDDGSLIATSVKGIHDAIKVKNATVYVYPCTEKEDGVYRLEGKLSLAEGVRLIGVGDEPVKVKNDWGSNLFSNQAHFTNTYMENIYSYDNLTIDAGIIKGDVVFKKCVFGGSNVAHQGVHFDSGQGTITFDECRFIGRNMFGSSIEMITFNNCYFENKRSSQTGADKWTGVNMWGKYEFNNCTFDTEAHCNVKTDGIEADFTQCKFVDNRDITTLIWNGNEHTANITFDGNKYIAEGLMEDPNGNAIASSESGLKEALANGGTVILANPFTIDQSESNGYGKTGINMTNGGTLDGNGNELGAPGSTGTWDSAINTSGGTIKNIKITEGFRGIFIKKDTEHNEKLFLDNVYIDGTTYTISCDSGNGLGLDANACTFNGWTSYAKTIGEVAFTKCSFGEGNGYAYCRPYAPTEFVDCAFEAGYQVDPVAAVTFENCTLDGVALTAENLSTLVTSNIANATVK